MDLTRFINDISKYNFRKMSLYLEKEQLQTNFRIIEATPETLTLQHINSEQIIVIYEKEYTTKNRRNAETRKTRFGSCRADVKKIKTV